MMEEIQLETSKMSQRKTERKSKSMGNSPQRTATDITGRNREMGDVSSQPFSKWEVDRTTDGKPTILILDDDPGIRKTLSRTLSANGYAPIAAAKAKTALDVVKKQEPAVALVDLKLELDDASGLEVMQEIKRHCLGTECIVITAYSTHETAIRAVNLGAYGYLQKPYDVEQLLMMIRGAIQKREAEEALRESEERYRILSENVTDVIWIMDMNLNFTYASPSAERLTGYTPDEEMAAGLSRILTPASLEVAAKAFEKGLAEEKRRDKRRPFGSMTIELDHIHKNGNIVPAEVRMTFLRDHDGRPVGILGTTRDISKRKEMEKALQQSEQDYRRLIESLNDSIFVVDAETSTIVFCNQRAARLYEFDSVDDLIGVNALDIIHPEDKAVVIKGFAEDVYEQERRQRYEIRTIGRHGTEIWVSALGTRTEFQGRVAVLLSVKDITELKKAEEEKQRMEQQLLLSGRLAAVGQLAAGVAHELNNPLTAVQGFAQLLASRDDLEEIIKSDVDSIYREAQRACKITTNLLSFARKHEPEKRFISINDTIDKSLELHTYRMKVNNIEISMDLDPDLPMTMADFHQMQQVFMNIVTNAEQAMTEAHGKGKLSIKTQKVGEMIQITFADDGPGMSEDNLKSIFDPFFTTKDVGKGTGLGLSICYGIVQEHGGNLYAKSKPGEGTTFVVEIPIVSEEQATDQQTDSVQIEQAPK